MNFTNPILYLGLSIFVVLYYTIFKKFQWLFLLLASLALYFVMEKSMAIYIIITSISIYFLGVKIQKINDLYPKKDRKKYSKKYLISGLLINFGILFGLKYLGLLKVFKIESFDFMSIIPPLGISFYTFKATSYLIDLYRSKYDAEKDFFKFATFVSYFPALLQGPIDKYDELSNTLYTKKNFDYENLVRGFYLILFGIMKKTVIADRLVEPIGNVVKSYTSYQGSVLFFAMFVFGIQIYADFSGGIDMVRGFSKILGIDLAENFNNPYFADSVAEYWRRWHMSLGAWMREYVFYPMSLSKSFANINKKSRKKFGPKYGKIFTLLISTIVVYLLIGAWHGARTISLLFGLFYGIVISISLVLENIRADIDKKLPLPYKFKYSLKILWVIFITTIGRYFSKANTGRELWIMLKYTVKNYFGKNFWANFYSAMNMKPLSYVVLIIGITIMIFAGIYKEKYGDFYEKIKRLKPVSLYLLLVFVIGFTIVFGLMGTNITQMEFVYQKY